MINDIYSRGPAENKYAPNTIDVTDGLSQLILKIENVLFTRKGDVLGVPDFGCNLEDLIYEFNFNNYKIKEVIEKQINVYCPLAQTHTVEVDVSFQRGEVRDIAYVDILINNKFLLTVNA